MIPLLKPGEPITEARLNEIINGVNAAQITSSDFPIERTSAGTKLKMPQRPQDFYARIVETEGRERDEGDAVQDGEYEWRQVWLPEVVDSQYPPQEFENLPDGEGLASFYDADSGKLLEPAYELNNDRTVPVDTLVRMRVYPGVHDPRRGFIRRYVFTHVKPSPLLYAKALSDWEENGTYPEGEPRIRCIQLIADPLRDPVPLHPKVETGEAILIELPRERPGSYYVTGEGASNSTDPALYEGDRLRFALDDQGRRICVSPYLHMGKIGDIRMMGNPAAGRKPRDAIPTGWWVCDGSERGGNSGNITLANFDRAYLALSGDGTLYGAGPVHSSPNFEVGEQCFHATFDAHGEAAFARIPQAVAEWYDTDQQLAAPNAHRHNIKSAQGEFPMETVYFYQRYK